METTVEITDSETWEGRYTVYKLVLNRESQCWFVHRRYSEFHRLYEQLKKQVPSLEFKFPGKRMLWNLERTFVRTRQRSLEQFSKLLISDGRLNTLDEVQEFLQLSHGWSRESSSDETASECAASTSAVDDDDDIDLGATERCHARPSEFEFLRVIGKGSFGKVYLARHRSERVCYAIKVLRKRTIVRRNETEHILSERNVLLKNLNHAFLVGLYYCFQTNDKLYFVLNYVSGGELFYYLQKERVFDERRACFYTAEAGSALGYLHSRGIIYRDLKPENMLLDREGHLVLTDFGLCKEGLIGSARTSTFCGTPEYMAPEVLLKLPYDRAVDWWCLGCVLFEMLHGLPPFYSRNHHRMYHGILNQEPRLRLSVSYPAHDLLRSLLDKDPVTRLGSGSGDFQEIQMHPFFRHIDWQLLLQRKIQPPFVPPSDGADDDVTNIDPSFAAESVGSSIGGSASLLDCDAALSASQTSMDRHFEGFSYHPCCPSA